MIFDKFNLFSEDQAITGSAASTNVIDLGVAGRGKGNMMEVVIQVTTAFADLTSLTVGVQTDTVEAFSSPTTLQSSAAIVAASLVAGYKFKIQVMPEGLDQYVRLYFTVAGTNATAGKVFAGIVFDAQNSY